MKKISTLFLVFLLCFLLTGCAEKKDEPKKEESSKEEHSEFDISKKDVNLSNDKANIDDSKVASLYKKLIDYGNDIYISNQHVPYPKKNNMIFISLNDLNKNFSYDISDFKGEDGTICDLDNSGIYFDIDNTLNLDYLNGAPPVFPSLVGCSIEESTPKKDKNK